MLLAIDVGNTNIAVGVYDGDRLAFHFRLSTDHRRTADEYGVSLRAMLQEKGLEPGRFTKAVLASVVPPLNRPFIAMCTDQFGVVPLVIGPGVKTGMPILYANPREVGADRIVNGVAGYERYRQEPGGPHGLIIVDFGTATTFDVVSPAGAYLGGVIAPGVGISTEALFRNASKLPRVELVMPDTCLGKTTVHSMQAGIMFGYVALVDGVVERLRAEIDFVPRVIATGGVAVAIAGRSATIEATDDLLTLRGLRIIHARNATPGAQR